MKDRYTDAIQNRFTAYLQAAIAKQKSKLLWEKNRILAKEIVFEDQSYKVIWILKSSITITRWNSRHLS